MDKTVAQIKRLLLVEDDPALQIIFASRLEVNGFDVIIASDGQMALAKARAENPDIILLDLMIPQINGFEVCRMLKFDDRYKRIPILVLSALSSQRDREKATQVGADGFFIKPFDMDLLLVKINDLIKKRAEAIEA